MFADSLLTLTHHHQTLKFQLFDKDHPMYTEPRTLPPTKVSQGSPNG